MSEQQHDEEERVREGEILPAPKRPAYYVAGPLMLLKFAQAYVQTNGNGVESARIAGYSGSNKQLAEMASRNLARPDVKQYIGEILKTVLTAEEAAAILSAIARGSIEPFLARDEEGQFIKTEFGYEFDLNRPEAQPHLHLIESIEPTKFGPKVKMCSKVKAIDIIARGMQIKTADLMRKLQVEAILDSFPDEVRDAIKGLIASAEARCVNEDNLLEPSWHDS